MLQHVFENWIDFYDLPDRIRKSDVCLGIFGLGKKSHRVIPNKVYQSLAVGKPVITMMSDAYPVELLKQESPGILFCEAGNPQSIADSISKLITLMRENEYNFASPRKVYEQYFSNEVIKSVLRQLMATSSKRK